jgi:uncharacterized protein (DUF924 family)/Ca2+-binding EF-hand superfamily protein
VVTPVIASTPKGVLDFWLGPLRDVSQTSEASWRERMLRWRVGVFARGFEDPEFSAAQHAFCDALHEQGQARVFADPAWQTPHGQLAKLIVLDQFPRCVYRGTPLAYENDLQLAGMLREICAQGWDLSHYSVLERLWVYVPLSHPENRELQELSVAKWTQWSSDLIAAAPAKQRRVNQRVGWNFVKAVIEHAEAVVMHGKFPHRNPILCRPHRAGEIHYLTNELRPPWSYTQPPRPDFYALHAALHGIERFADCRKVDRELLRSLHGVLGLNPDEPGSSLMEVFDVLGREPLDFRDVYRHLMLARNGALCTQVVASPAIIKHMQSVRRAIYKEGPKGWRSSELRGGVPKVIDVPALNLAVGCPLLDRGEVCAPRSAIENFIQTSGFRICSFQELYARYREVVSEAVAGFDDADAGLRRRAPIERAAFAKLAAVMFEPSPAFDGAVNTLYELLDLDYDGTVDAGEVLVALVALCTGSVDDKLHVCFEVFDADDNGRLDSAELNDLVHTTLLRGLHVVEALFRNYLPEGSRESTELVTLFSLANFSRIEHLAERALADADHDRDGMIDEPEFRAWAREHPLLVQLLTLSRVLFGS